MAPEPISLATVPKAAFDRVRGCNASAPERTRLFATLARLNTLTMIMRAGSGHIGSSFSSLDVVSWLYLNELTDGQDRYFSSKGHDVPGLYSVLAALGVIPFEQIHRLRQLGGLPGHPDVETPGMVANTGSLGMGISKAKGMVLADRLRGKTGRVFVLLGDGELQEGQIWESLISAANRGLYEITAIVDHNKIQSDTWVKDVSDLGDLEAKFRAFGWYVVRSDGHDHATLERVFADLATVTDRPKMLIADTVKGYGVSFMAHTAMLPEQELYSYHSGAPKLEEYRRAVDELTEAIKDQAEALGLRDIVPDRVTWEPPTRSSNAQRLVPAYTEALIAAANRRPELVALDADLILDTGLIPFRNRFPDRFFECGIAEQDMVSQASGMALNGLLPVVHSFSCFLSARPNEQIFNACSENRKIIYAGFLAGLIPAAPGHSHQATRDIATLAAMPGLTLVEPCCPAEVAPLLDWCVDQAVGPCYLRLFIAAWDIPFTLPQDYRVAPGCGITLRNGTDAVIIGYGPVLLSQAWEAAERVARTNGMSVQVVNLPWLNRVDADWLAGVIAGKRLIVTLDNHSVVGGQSDRITAALAQMSQPAPPPIERFGVVGIPACGTPAEVLRAHRLDVAAISERLTAATT